MSQRLALVRSHPRQFEELRITADASGQSAAAPCRYSGRPILEHPSKYRRAIVKITTLLIAALLATGCAGSVTAVAETPEYCLREGPTFDSDRCARYLAWMTTSSGGIEEEWWAPGGSNPGPAD